MQYIHQQHEECNCGDYEAGLPDWNGRYAHQLDIVVHKISSGK